MGTLILIQNEGMKRKAPPTYLLFVLPRGKREAISLLGRSSPWTAWFGALYWVFVVQISKRRFAFLLLLLADYVELRRSDNRQWINLKRLIVIPDG
jgi:hypothetical protein